MRSPRCSCEKHLPSQADVEKKHEKDGARTEQWLDAPRLSSCVELIHPLHLGTSGDRTPWVPSLARTLGAAAAWRETIQKVKMHICFSLVEVVFLSLN